MFSRSVHSKGGRTLIEKVPETWDRQEVFKQLNNIIALANEANDEGYQYIEYNGTIIVISDLRAMYIAYKFLGIPYKYGELK